MARTEYMDEVYGILVKYTSDYWIDSAYLLLSSGESIKVSSDTHLEDTMDLLKSKGVHIEILNAYKQDPTLVKNDVCLGSYKGKGYKYNGKTIEELVNTFNFKSKLAGMPLRAIQKEFSVVLEVLDSFKVERFIIPDWVNIVKFKYGVIVEVKDVKCGKFTLLLNNARFIGMESIEYGLFTQSIQVNYLSNIKKLVIPKNIKALEFMVLENAEELEELDLSQAVELREIPYLTNRLPNLKKLILPPFYSKIREGVFGSTPNLEVIVAPLYLGSDIVIKSSFDGYDRIKSGVCRLERYKPNIGNEKLYLKRIGF